MSKASLKNFRSRQQIKDDQINYLLGDLEKIQKNINLPLTQKKISYLTLEKYQFPLKKSYDNVVKENTDLKAYIQKLKQHFQQQPLQFLKEQKNYYQEPPKKI